MATMELIIAIIAGLAGLVIGILVFWFISKQKTEKQNIGDRFVLEFENIANRVLQDKKEQFAKDNKTSLELILNPLKEDLKNFKNRIHSIDTTQAERIAGLKTEIGNLVKFSTQISTDANNLTNALRGTSKMQGDWGEAQLETLLEKSGLQKDVHYKMQASFKDEHDKTVRPDCVVSLPGDKNIIIDSKVSLSAYEKYFNTDDVKQKDVYLKRHLESINAHIKDLSSKNYQKLHDINSPDYVLMFFPLESALILAMKEDISICEKAMSKDVMLVSNSTILPTLRAINSIWQQEYQKKNVLEIARQGGAMYDKFVSFTEDLQSVGSFIDKAKQSQENALNKLCTSKKKGDTLVGRAQMLKKLGAKTTKSIPSEILEKIDEEDVSSLIEKKP